MVCTGCSQGDIFQNMMTYGLFTGGLGLHYGAEKAGLTVIPASSGNTKRQLWLMKEFGTTVVHATPSYMLHIYSELVKEGVGACRSAAQKGVPRRRALFGKYAEENRVAVQASTHTIPTGLSEMNGPGVAFECVYKCGMHVWEDSYIVEVVDPDTLEPCRDGEEGELVFTTLNARQRRCCGTARAIFENF